MSSSKVSFILFVIIIFEIWPSMGHLNIQNICYQILANKGYGEKVDRLEKSVKKLTQTVYEINSKDNSVPDNIFINQKLIEMATSEYFFLFCEKKFLSSYQKLLFLFFLELL